MARKRDDYGELSRRERQIMDIVYRIGSATATEVRAALPDPPSYSAVRAMLRILEEKGHLKHEQDGPRYVFHATLPVETGSGVKIEPLKRPGQPALYTERDLHIRQFTGATARRLTEPFSLRQSA